MATAPGGVEVASVSAASSGGSSFGGGSGVGRHCRWLLAGWLLALGRLVLRARETQRAGGRADRCVRALRSQRPPARAWGARGSPPHTTLRVCQTSCCLTRADTSEPAAFAGHRYLLELTASSCPAGSDGQGRRQPLGGAAFDCSWRKLAYSYVPRLHAVTKTKAKELFDALELEALCGETFDATTRPHSSTPLAHATADATIYVSNEGSDGNEGTSIKATGRDSPRGALQVAQAVLLGGEEALRRVAPPASRHLTCTQAMPPAPLFARVPVRSLSAAASLCHSL
jgi:hypothetical protein